MSTTQDFQKVYTSLDAVYGKHDGVFRYTRLRELQHASLLLPAASRPRRATSVREAAQLTMGMTHHTTGQHINLVGGTDE